LRREKKTDFVLLMIDDLSTVYVILSWNKRDNIYFVWHVCIAFLSLCNSIFF